MRERYLFGTGLKRAADVNPGTPVEVIYQSKRGGKSRGKILRINRTSQLNNEQVVFLDDNGHKHMIGGGTSVNLQ